jgi:beta-carotene 15,15'-dioxygenase
MPTLSPQSKINLLFLLVSITLMLMHHFALTIETSVSYPILFGVVLSLGLIHGCLDFEIAKRTNPQSTLARFLLGYITQILAVGLVWLVNPQLALLIFLACTAWHFGETDLSLFKRDTSKPVIWMYGIGITAWLLGNHLDENLSYVFALGLADPTNLLFVDNIQEITIWISILSLVLVAAASFLSGLYRSKSNLLSLGMLLGVTYFLPILPAFTAYFGFWHSMHTLYLIRTDIKLSVKGLIVRAAPYFLVSIVMTALMVFLFEAFKLSSQAVLVVFISSLTLPHAQTMHRLLLRYRLGEAAA